MPGSFRIGKMADIEVTIHVSWLLIVILFTWSMATDWFSTLLTAFPSVSGSFTRFL